jgi:hypothetical protein
MFSSVAFISRFRHIWTSRTDLTLSLKLQFIQEVVYQPTDMLF